MANLNITCIQIDTGSDMKKIAEELNSLERHSIGEMLWIGVEDKPVATFAIAYADDGLLLKYFVSEKFLVVMNNTDQSPVYLDSCVEFFLSFGDDGAYYNLELNSIGTCLFAFGKNRHERLEIHATDRIRRFSSITSSVEEGKREVYWELTVVIPFGVFTHHQITFLKGTQCKANFYKCGDALPDPHYLAWNKVHSETPNFHLPVFFGTLYFQ